MAEIIKFPNRSVNPSEKAEVLAPNIDSLSNSDYFDALSKRARALVEFAEIAEMSRPAQRSYVYAVNEGLRQLADTPKQPTID